MRACTCPRLAAEALASAGAMLHIYKALACSEWPDWTAQRQIAVFTFVCCPNLTSTPTNLQLQATCLQRVARLVLRRVQIAVLVFVCRSSPRAPPLAPRLVCGSRGGRAGWMSESDGTCKRLLGWQAGERLQTQCRGMQQNSSCAQALNMPAHHNTYMPAAAAAAQAKSSTHHLSRLLAPGRVLASQPVQQRQRSHA